ncbi:MAG: hypothetical protein PHS42_03695 [Sulfurimonas sp.]|nr:hypothetical protein [Sulfurimonas sp.]MDD3834556.1 hypothetical protein [Sulfurimonas sp.]
MIDKKINNKELEYIVNGEVVVIEELSKDELSKIFHEKYFKYACDNFEPNYEGWTDEEHIAIAIAKFEGLKDGCRITHQGGGIAYQAYDINGYHIGNYTVFSEVASEH